MGLWDGGIKFAPPGFLVALGAALAAPIILPALARIAPPVAKEAIRLYFHLADDIQEVVAHHQDQRRTSAGLFNYLFRAGGEELITEELEVGTEETLTQTVLEGIAEIL
jgi:hypothetical protein